MHNRHPLFTKLSAIGVTVLLATGCSSFAKNPVAERNELRQSSDASSEYRNRIGRHLYAGIGLGSSLKEPDTSEVPDVDVDDRVSGGGQITLGVDLSRQWSIELHAADLGNAGISPTGEISYRTFGGSALFYLGKNRHNWKREGLSGFGRIGYSALQNESIGDVEFEQINSTHFLFGAGVEYMTRLGLGLRLEGIAFEEDAQYGQLGLIYRTGRRERSRPIEIVQAPAPVIQQPVIPQPIIAAPVPALAVQPMVEEIPYDSCSEFSGTLEGVKFHTDSANLTTEADLILEGVASRLAECPSAPIGLTAHTDSVGEDAYNQKLSSERAKSVMRFLVNRGIDISRIQARAFGETRPIDTNETAAGRERNRRVELITN